MWILLIVGGLIFFSWLVVTAPERGVRGVARGEARELEALNRELSKYGIIDYLNNPVENVQFVARLKI